MPRQLNPDYIRRTMAKESLTGLAVVFLTGEQFGVSVCDESLMTDDGWVDDDAPDRYDRDRLNYKGWSEPGKLYCATCWTPVLGVPRDILAANWCRTCNSQLYPADDEDRLDSLGYEIYRDRVTRYMQIAVRHFAGQIPGNEHLRPNGGVAHGYHKDHIYSVRDAFENDVIEHVVSSPPNLRVLPSRKNVSKGRKSGCTLEELLGSYNSFVAVHDEWVDLIRQSDEKQQTFIWSEEDDRYAV